VHDDISPLPNTEAAVYRLVVCSESFRYVNQNVMKKPVPEHTIRGLEGRMAEMGRRKSHKAGKETHIREHEVAIIEGLT
jgi:hypothetical protein